MSPLYNSQLVANTPLQAVMPDQIIPATLLNAETPAAGQASLACALASRGPEGQLTPVALRFSCPLGIGGGVFEIQTADVDADAEYTAVAFGGATPGTVASANFAGGGSSAAGTSTARVELLVRARFLRVVCTTAPAQPVTVTVE